MIFTSQPKLENTARATVSPTPSPYRRARPFAVAKAELLRCRGTQFDPGVVDAFLAVPQDEWERIRLDVVKTVAVLSADLAERPPIPKHEDRALEPSLRSL